LGNLFGSWIHEPLLRSRPFLSHTRYWRSEDALALLKSALDLDDWWADPDNARVAVTVHAREAHRND
jgi:hypothetical protein